jgi:hypothetical protein
MLDNAALKDLLGKKWWRPRGSGKLSPICENHSGWGKGRWPPPVRMIKLTEARQITPYKWVHPDEQR